MDERRLAAVFALDTDKSPKTSTSYVVAPRLLLTAAHAVESANKVEVQLIDQADAMPCTVVWDGRGHDLDAALLEVDAQHWPSGMPDEPVRFGLLATLQPGAPAEAIGFPAAQRAADGELETAHAHGHINPGDKLLSGHWVLSIAGTSPGDLGSSPWAGMSGAPLYSGNLLCGVLVVDPAHWRHGKLDAVQAHRLLQNEEFSSLLREHLGYSPAAEAVELESLAEPVILSRPPRSLPELLRPQAETVRFVGRQEQVAEFRAWCQGKGVTARLLIGPGGQGKTRFARELARILAAEGWVVAQLRDTAPAEGYKILGKVNSRLLLIMDYADTRPGSVAEVMRMLEEEGGRGTVRVLLIARSAGEWWDHLPASASAYISLLSGATVIQMDALPDNLPTRQSVYSEAVLDLARGLRRLPDYARTDWEILARALPAPDLGDTRLGSPLTLQLRALTDLLTAHPGAQQAKSGSTVEALFLEHEERYWTKTAARRMPLRELGPEELGDAVAAATLTRVSRKERAVELLASLPSLKDSPERVRIALATWLSDLYPASTGSYWGALEPDRLGEYHVSERARKDPRLLREFLTALDTEEAIRAFTVLARAGAQPVCPCPNLLGQVSGLIVLHPECLAVPAAYVATQSENPDFLVEALSALDIRPDLPVDLLENLNTAFPPQTASLAGPALNVAECLVTANRRAARRLWLPPWLSQRSSAARPPAEETRAPAVQVSDATARLADLARAYHNYSHRLMGLGRWDQAIKAADHAARLYRRLARRHPDLYRPLLAGTLDNQAMALGATSRLKSALKASQKARTVHRVLAADDSDAHLVSLARSLSNVSEIFAGLGAGRAALGTSAEAVAILSRLADRKAGLYLPELGGALHNQAAHYAEAARFDEAAATSVRAVEIRRRLAVQRPDANLPGLAHSLHNFAIDLFMVGKKEAASKVLEESISLYLRLVLDKRDGYLPYLANALNTRSVQCRDRNEIQEAVISSARSLFFYIWLAKERPADFREELSTALRNHRWDLIEAGLTQQGKWESVLNEAGQLIQRDLQRTPKYQNNRTLNEDEAIRKLTQNGLVVSDTEADDFRLRFKEVLDRYSGMETAKALINHDTGASATVLSRSIRRLLGREPRPSPLEVNGIRRRVSSMLRFRVGKPLYQRTAPHGIVDLFYEDQLLRLTRMRKSVAEFATERKRTEFQILAMRKRQAKENRQGEGAPRLHRDERATDQTARDGQFDDLDRRYSEMQVDEETLTLVAMAFHVEVIKLRSRKEATKETDAAAEAADRAENAIGMLSRELARVGMGMRRAQDRTTYMQARAADSSLQASAIFQNVNRVDIQTDLKLFDDDIAAEVDRLKSEINTEPAL